MEASYYVGDAAGRTQPKDHNDTDLGKFDDTSIWLVSTLICSILFALARNGQCGWTTFLDAGKILCLA